MSISTEEVENGENNNAAQLKYPEGVLPPTRLIARAEVEDQEEEHQCREEVDEEEPPEP